MGQVVRLSKIYNHHAKGEAQRNNHGHIPSSLSKQGTKIKLIKLSRSSSSSSSYPSDPQYNLIWWYKTIAPLLSIKDHPQLIYEKRWILQVKHLLKKESQKMLLKAPFPLWIVFCLLRKFNNSIKNWKFQRYDGNIRSKNTIKVTEKLKCQDWTNKLKTSIKPKRY